MKQNAQTNQTKLTNKSNETQTNPRWNAHMQHNRERDRKRKRECERERKKEVMTYDGWQRGSRWWQWQSVLRATVALMRTAVAAWCWEWGFVWESKEESDRFELGGESELGRFFNLGFFCYWEVLLTYWGFLFF